ncbi:CRP-like cAMP-binding protein [Azospirillum agricola]|uniref:Crp/Fnr family transcriptional regulator n=1 Tax=Azospirillum agricola TaxID=1720247 RepID=UPI001AEB0BA0|nr:Crp/Fnr family transcriptional regulator [Azospirillum agricola]MBP2230799.1 CRP-like cAMP-binding protein [Azospirillum agricola]
MEGKQVEQMFHPLRFFADWGWMFCLTHFEMETEERFASIRDCPFFSGAGESALSALANASQLRSFVAGQTLFRAGSPGDCLYVIASGRVSVSTTRGGRYAWLNELGAPASVGEVGAIQGAPRTATVIAETDVTAIRIERDDLQAALAAHPPLVLAALHAVCDLVGRLAEREGAHALGLPERLAALLLDLAGSDGVVQHTQGDVAHRLGTRRETVVRLLRQFRQQGLVAAQGGKTQVIDRAALYEIARPR